MRLVYVWIVALMLTSVCVESQLPDFLVDPVSIAAVHGTTVEFSCIANKTDSITYRVNGSSAASSSITNKGFMELDIEELDTMITRRNLTVTVSSLYNNTEIFCRAEGSPMNVDSEVAYLTVQGPLSSVGDLSYSFINFSTVNISWSPPFTLPGTAITGYNISVTSNETTTDYFTSDSHYVLQLSDITDSPCNEINIAVLGYNGLNGETESISVPSSDVVVPLSVDISEVLQITVTINVTSVCIDERPTNVDITLFQNDTEVNHTDVVFPDDPKNSTLTVVDIYDVVEDNTYTITASFSIFDGGLDVSSRHIFYTFGVQSIDVNDTPEDSVTFNCTFHSFSTDTGCTVQLLLSGIVRYTGTFSRSGDTATGSISGIATGLYQVHVFDQGNPTVVLTSEFMVIGEPAIATTITSVTSSISITTPTVLGTPSTTTTTTATATISKSVPAATQPINSNSASDSQTTLYIAIAVPVGAVTIILLAVVLTVVCVMWRKKYRNSNKLKSVKSPDALACTGFDGSSGTVSSPPQDIADLYSRPNKQPVTVEPVIYADLTEIKKKHRPSPTKTSDSRVVYSDVLITRQAPPPPHEPVELVGVSNIQTSVTVIPVGTNETEMVTPERRPPNSPLVDGIDQSPPIPNGPAEEKKGFTDESVHPELGELTSDKDGTPDGWPSMNTPTATYL